MQTHTITNHTVVSLESFKSLPPGLHDLDRDRTS